LRRDHVEFSVFRKTASDIRRTELQAVEALQNAGPTPISDGQVLTLNASGGSVCGSRGGSISVDPGRVLLAGELVTIGSS
jgi:hypothetical protein